MGRSGRDPTRSRPASTRAWRSRSRWLLFALLAVPLGFGVERTRSMAVSGLIGIAWVCVYYTLRTTASMLASGGVMFAAAAPWLLLAVFAGLGGWRLSKIQT